MRNLLNRIFLFSNSEQSTELALLPFTIKRRGDRGIEHVSVIYLRFSKLNGYKYLTVKFFHYLTINIDFHEPL